MILGRICKHFGISEIIGFVIGGIILGLFALGGVISFFDKPIVELSDSMLSFWQVSGIIILFSVILIIAVLSKIIGSGITTTILLKDKNKGLRTRYGMIVRGEITFITAGIGLSYGIISDNIFLILIFVILGTIFIEPILETFS